MLPASTYGCTRISLDVRGCNEKQNKPDRCMVSMEWLNICRLHVGLCRYARHSKAGALRGSCHHVRLWRRVIADAGGTHSKSLAVGRVPHGGCTPPTPDGGCTPVSLFWSNMRKGVQPPSCCFSTNSCADGNSLPDGGYTSVFLFLYLQMCGRRYNLRPAMPES